MSETLPPIDPPTVERPSVPTYGIPETLEGTRPWSWAEARLAAAETYWVATRASSVVSMSKTTPPTAYR